MDLQLSDTPVSVAAVEGELHRILTDAVLHARSIAGPNARLTISTSTVMNPVVPALPLPKGRYGRVVITDAASSEFVYWNTVPWVAGGLEGRVIIATDAEGRASVTLLLPSMAEL